ncbi:hypothetical protein DYB30_011246 [Aphanomyces astaci]|uniref:AAA+ ATPase domain-containing protein n=1 Tax=Aphanomyces astaci TaxID=112090 RepID=A0A397CNT9_APHAT|nr:hypothetical protein DYB38_009054 [Aphanomyces astaci]RHY49002.1 hypothetical protein DYB30_011246 [Aphanomyces astaci]RHY67507.1 hypothetical protein DYB34_009303 [Aphanomyces astaci]RQM25110.1 hypothetical protein B5M09_008118 [Aphanomyces astaci]
MLGMSQGVLLCGPSGTGKTLLARAVAAEAGVAFLFCSASDFVEMLVGRGASRVLDPALLRPGRFDRHVFVGLPDAAGREAILRVHTKRIRLDASVSLAALARHPQLEGASGAALACLVNEAALMAVRTNDTVAKMKHFELAVARAAASATSDRQYQ